MNRRRIASTLTMLLLFFAVAGLGWRAIRSPAIVRAQQGLPLAPAAASTAFAAAQAAPAADGQQAQTPAGGAIKAETREVRVDVVVTDKKGNYVQDLTTNDFRLYEDDKQQPINSFTFGADPNGSNRSETPLYGSVLRQFLYGAGRPTASAGCCGKIH